MRLQRKNRIGVTSLEYAILVAALIFAILAVQTTLRRAIASKWKETADGFGSGRQYDPATTTVTTR